MFMKEFASLPMKERLRFYELYEEQREILKDEGIENFTQYILGIHLNKDKLEVG